MSVIAIVLDFNSVSAQTVMKLHRALGISIQSIKDAWAAGLPIVEIEIFEGDYQANAQAIRSVLKIIKENSLMAKFYELPYGEQYERGSSVGTWEIGAEVVANILNTADEEVERQLDS
ncbi:hypothetical protein [Pseudomonas sp. R3-18-08]|uniref:hypothetical protein n=1 Tax=Pseudomonas sp. R3-18-08 TaxID=1173283 RepID=UPI000F56C1C1|nr:hypothetical protein [Pseudomonas sp. R3-18-08]AZF13719.1 hypothetical protein C4J92_0202 [Pseudomonas sp. R3-18-08]